jgi:hypothetical protein
MAIDRWTVAAVAQEETAKALQQYKIDEKIRAGISSELDTKIKQEIEIQFADLRKTVKIMNEQILILKDAMETLSKKYNQ